MKAATISTTNTTTTNTQTTDTHTTAHTNTNTTNTPNTTNTQPSSTQTILKAHPLSPEQMAAYKFTNENPLFFYYCVPIKTQHVPKDTDYTFNFSIHIPTNKVKLQIIDETHGDIYKCAEWLKRRSNNSFVKTVQEFIRKQIEHLRSIGVLVADTESALITPTESLHTVSESTPSLISTLPSTLTPSTSSSTSTSTVLTQTQEAQEEVHTTVQPIQATLSQSDTPDTPDTQVTAQPTQPITALHTPPTQQTQQKTPLQLAAEVMRLIQSNPASQPKVTQLLQRKGYHVG